jgi:hypothetical protein
MTPDAIFAVPADHPNLPHGGANADRSQCPFSAWPTGSLPWAVVHGPATGRQRFAAEGNKISLSTWNAPLTMTGFALFFWQG